MLSRLFAVAGLPIAAALLVGSVAGPSNAFAQYDAPANAGNPSATASPGNSWYNRTYGPNNVTKLNAKASTTNARATTSVAKNYASQNDTNRVLSPFAPPPVPRAPTTRARSSNNSAQVQRDPRRTMSSPRSPAQFGSAPYANKMDNTLDGNGRAGSSPDVNSQRRSMQGRNAQDMTQSPRTSAPQPNKYYQKRQSLFDKSKQAEPYSRADMPTPPQVQLPSDSNSVQRDPRGDDAGVPNLTPAPRAMQYDPRNAPRNSQGNQRNQYNTPGNPRAFKPDTQPLPVGSRSQVQDAKTAREQLRAIQQERISREAERLKSEQAKLKAAAIAPRDEEPQPTPKATEQPLPRNESNAQAADPGDGPLLFTPANGTGAK